MADQEPVKVVVTPIYHQDRVSIITTNPDGTRWGLQLDRGDARKLAHDLITALDRLGRQSDRDFEARVAAAEKAKGGENG